jgi:hypothetical protein
MHIFRVMNREYMGSADIDSNSPMRHLEIGKE